ncbi:MAG: hypothetical protein U0031_22885 [Thermomicrobiales bacterium]
MAKNTRRRNQLLSRDPRCHWCGVAVIYIRAERWAKGTMPANFATVDHLRDRLAFPDREQLTAGEGEQTVLACLACNLRRNEEAHRVLKNRATADDADNPAPNGTRAG